MTHVVYGGTLQADALALVAAKVRSSLMVEGDLPEDGLAALEGDTQDVFVALARPLTEAGAAHEQSLEALFAQSRAVEAQAEDLLVDEEWSDEPEPMSAVASPQGRVMTLDELAALPPQRRPRPQAVPEAQLALFGT